MILNGDGGDHGPSCHLHGNHNHDPCGDYFAFDHGNQFLYLCCDHHGHNHGDDAQISSQKGVAGVQVHGRCDQEKASLNVGGGAEHDLVVAVQTYLPAVIQNQKFGI